MLFRKKTWRKVATGTVNGTRTHRRWGVVVDQTPLTVIFTFEEDINRDKRRITFPELHDDENTRAQISAIPEVYRWLQGGALPKDATLLPFN